MPTTYYYLNDARDVVGPVSEETLKELHSVEALGEKPQVCEAGTENWIQYDDAFPAIPISPEHEDPSSSSQPTSQPVDSDQASPPPLPTQSVEKSAATPTTPRSSSSTQTGTTTTGTNRNIKPIMIGCGVAALLAFMVAGFGIISMIVNGGGEGDAESNSTSISASAPGTGAGYYDSPCQRCGGAGQLRGQCNRCRGNGTIMTGNPNSLDPLRSRNPPMQVPCPQCSGDGRMPVRCSHCGGTGRN